METKTAKHTPEPWTWNICMSGRVHIGTVPAAEDKNRYAIGDAIGEVHDLNGTRSDGEVEANAARIVQCVNACEGIENPESVKELIEAAKLAEDAMGIWDSGGDIPFPVNVNALRALRAALARMGVK